MDFKASVRQTVEDHGSAIVDLSTKIHDHPELAFEEVKASNWCKELLVANGFDVESPVADLDTAFRATFGNGELNLAFCAEYDALPDIGHACGHNIIAASSIATALALKPIADELNVTLTVLGTLLKRVAAARS